MTESIEKLMEEKFILEREFDAKEKAISGELKRLGLARKLRWSKSPPDRIGLWLLKNHDATDGFMALLITPNGAVVAGHGPVSVPELVASGRYLFAGPVEEPLAIDEEIEGDTAIRRKITL